MDYTFRFDVAFDNLGYILKGVYITLGVTALSILMGLIIGLFVGILRLSRYRFISIPMIAYIEFFRNIPALVKLIWVYYMIPILLGIELSAFASATIALGIAAGAFFAEIYRAGIEDVDRGHIEAAQSLGMSDAYTMIHIILPQAIRKMLPAFANTFISFLKFSSLVSVLGVADLTYRTQVISTQTFRPMELFTLLAVVYFFLCFILSQLVGWLERRMAVSERY
jgi:His/Glu/Gln/Arg/opine family amino acid ABC transporter permease subunit